LIKFGITSRDNAMPNFKKYNYSQSAMVVIDFEEQLQPGTFEFTLHKLIDNLIDLSFFHEKYSNDGGGRSAYDPHPAKDHSVRLCQRHHLKPRDPVAM
jgi:hypothetical protein